MSEDPIRDAQPMREAEPLGYRTREEWEGLAKAYRIVGWFLLMYAAVNLLGTVAQLLAIGQAMSSLASLGQLVAMIATSIPLAIGGIAMVRTRSWGAVLAFVAEGLMALTMLVLMASDVNAGSTIARSLTTVSLVRAAVLHIVIAFLPYAIWQLCRRRSVFCVAT